MPHQRYLAVEIGYHNIYLPPWAIQKAIRY
jgi:hypothetical protein